MKTTQIEPHKSSLGMDANINVLMIYIGMVFVSWLPFIGYLAFAVPIVFFVLEKESKFIKYQAAQVLIIGIVRAITKLFFDIVYWAVAPKDNFASAWSYVNGGWILSVIVGFIGWVISLAITGLVIYLVYMAYFYKQVELPGIGPIVQQISGTLDNININVNVNSNVNTNQNSNAGQPSQPEPENNNPENKNDSDGQNNTDDNNP